ncbi:MAG: Hpt domain-containing protein [Nitrospirae bacterium]|nr:Hpt domain-containing protein [Nitrospirota bacterium]
MPKHTHKKSLNEAACPAWLEGDNKLFKGIMAVFIRNVPPLMDRLKDALEANDAVQVKVLSHSLKGSASMIGAHPLRDAAFRAESAAIEGDLEKARGFYCEMKAELENVLAALNRTK